MSKKNSSAIMQEVAQNEAKVVELQPATTEQSKKSLQDFKKEFDRLNDLFNRKNRFESALQKLSDFSNGLKDDDPNSLDSSKFTLILDSGYRGEEIRISNRLVICEALSYLRSKIYATVEGIEAEILK